MSSLISYLKVATVLLLLAIATTALLYVTKPQILLSVFLKTFDRLRSMEQITPTTYRYIPRDTPYETWIEKSRYSVPMHHGLLIEDVRSIPLEAWAEMGKGISGLYLRFADYQISDGRLLQIPQGGQTAPQRHLYEMVVYALGGPGYTLFTQEGRSVRKLEWNDGSIFSIPLNVQYQHYNTAGKPIRLLAITSFPFVINAWNNLDFIDDNTFVFDERYAGEADYFASSEHAAGRWTRTNKVANARGYPLVDYSSRGEGARTMHFDMAGNEMLALHISSSPPRSTKRAHRHTSDAFILILAGEGYTVTWPESDYDKRIRVNWQPGTLFVPPTYWYHQHFNSGSEASRHLAVNVPYLVRRLGLRLEDQLQVDLPALQSEWEAEIGSQSR